MPIVVKLTSPTKFFPLGSRESRQDYFVPPRSLLTHMGLSVPSVERLDVSLTFGQAIAISGFVHRPPDAILAMTHLRLPRDCQKLVRLKYPSNRPVDPALCNTNAIWRSCTAVFEKLDAGLARDMPRVRRLTR